MPYVVGKMAQPGPRYSEADCPWCLPKSCWLHIKGQALGLQQLERSWTAGDPKATGVLTKALPLQSCYYFEALLHSQVFMPLRDIKGFDEHKPDKGPSTQR